MLIRFLIGAICIAAIILGAAFVLSKVNTPKNTRVRVQTKAADDALTSLPYPVLAVEDSSIIRTDGNIITGIKIYPENASLYDRQERAAHAQKEGKLFASIHQPFSIISIRKTPDNVCQRASIDNALAVIDAELATLISTSNASSRKELLLFRRDILTRIAADETDSQRYASPTQTETFITLITSPKKGTDTRAVATEAATSLLSRAASLGFSCSLLKEDDFMWLQKAYFDEVPTSGKNVDPYNLWIKTKF